MSVAVLALGLVGCSGTIQRESNSGSNRIQGATYSGVDVVLTDAARKLQAENPQFSVRELSDYMRRRLEALDLIKTEGTHRVEVTIESFRVRTAVAAVLFGIMAGTDNIEGRARVVDSRGRQVHSFKVDTSYGLGGWGGGQDGTRMNWLYDKFAELTVAELAGTTAQADLNKRQGTGTRTASPSKEPAPQTAVSITPSAVTSTQVRPSQAPAQPQTPASPQVLVQQPTANAATPARTPAPPPLAIAATQTPVAVTVNAGGNQAPVGSEVKSPRQVKPHQRVVPAESGYARADNHEALPVPETGKNRFRHYLTLPEPKAFVVYEDGGTRFWFNSGDAMTNLLDGCAREGRKCWLYAVDDKVVWQEQVAQRIGRTSQLQSK